MHDSSRPNFLFIITDQQRADYLGCYGHPVLKTPNIDRIAKGGTRFDRFYVSTPVCMPNRATLMTGRTPSVHGVRHNGINLPVNANTFVEMLRTSGYRTALVGKSHLQVITDIPPQRRAEPSEGTPPPATHREATLGLPDERANEQEHPRNWLRGENFPMSAPYYGFDTVRLCTEHGDEVGGHYYHWLKARCEDPTSLVGPANSLPHDYVCPQAWRTALPVELHPTTYVADEAIAQLRAYAVADRMGAAPFFMQVSFPDPHHPFAPPGQYWDMYDPADMPLPGSFRRADPQRQPHVAWLQAQFAEGKANRNTPGVFAVDEREAREAMALTCGSIAMIDAAVGRVLAELERLGKADNTIIVFTSDHGDLMGDHQLMLKGPMHFQGLIRVPFIWNDPSAGAADETCDALAGTIDIARTILDRAGVAPFNGMQGMSLLPLMEPQAGSSREAFYVEDEVQRTAYGFSTPPRCRTIVTRRWRLTVFHRADWGELYDLDNDPDELENLWFDPAFASRRAELVEALLQCELDHADRSPLPTQMA